MKQKYEAGTIPGILGADPSGTLEWSFLPSGSFLDKISFLWRYGIDILYNIPKKVRPMIANLDKIYELQEQGQSFKSFDDLFGYLGLLSDTKISGLG